MANWWTQMLESVFGTQGRAAASPFLHWRDRGASPTGGTMDLSRRRDPVTQTEFAPGESVRVHDCEAAYHEASYQLLLKENGARCGCCGLVGTWRRVTAAAPSGRAGAAPEPLLPVPRPPAHVPPEPVLEPALPLVTPATAAAHFGRFVRFEGQVQEVHVSEWNGTAFLQFERGYRFHVVKVVIFANYLPRFVAARRGPDDLCGARIAVRGLLQAHPRWGPQIIVHDPGCIEIQEAP